MNPTVLTVSLEDSAAHVVSQLISLKVDRLFVVDAFGVLVGVISRSDVLGQLHS